MSAHIASDNSCVQTNGRKGNGASRPIGEEEQEEEEEEEEEHEEHEEEEREKGEEGKSGVDTYFDIATSQFSIEPNTEEIAVAKSRRLCLDSQWVAQRGQGRVVGRRAGLEGRDLLVEAGNGRVVSGGRDLGFRQVLHRRDLYRDGNECARYDACIRAHKHPQGSE